MLLISVQLREQYFALILLLFDDRSRPNDLNLLRAARLRKKERRGTRVVFLKYLGKSDRAQQVDRYRSPLPSAKL